MSLTVDVNPFQYIPILMDGSFDISSQVYAYVVTDPFPISSKENFVDIMQEIITLKGMAEILLNTNIGNIVLYKHLLADESVVMLDHISNSANNFIDTLEHVLDDVHDFNEVSFAILVETISDIWTMTWIPLRKDTEDFLASIETNAVIVKYNFPALLQREISHLIEQIQRTIDDLSTQIMKLYKNPIGFGFRYNGTLNIFSLTIPRLEIEFDYSVNRPVMCGHFRNVYELLKGERAIRIYGTLLTGKLELAPFVHMETGFSIALAISANTPGNVIAQVQAKTNILGIRAKSDIFLTSTGHYFFLQGKIWNTFLADLKISFQSSRRRIETFDVLGHFVESVRDISFHTTYLNELQRVTQKVAYQTETRLRISQRAINIALENYLKSQDYLADKRASFRSATLAYSKAEQSLKQAQDDLNHAEIPYKYALSALGEAQTKVNNLCEIRSCIICIPGRRCRTCWFIIFPYTCCYYTSCLYKVIDPHCYAYNLGCMAVRALAYYFLESAKILVRTSYLAFEAAKRRVSNAQIYFDASRFALDIANDAFDLAQIKLNAAEAIFESAKMTFEAIKIVVRWGIKTLNYITDYGINNIFDVKNCGFRFQVSSQDTKVFLVECEIDSFKEGYKIVRLGINFGSPLQSIWQAAKGTIDTFVDSSRHLSDRNKREIKFKAMNGLHDAIRKARNAETTQDEFNSFDNDTIIDTFVNTNGFKRNVSAGDYENRVEIFQEKCSVMKNVTAFFSEAVHILLEMSNETAHTLNNSSSDEGSIIEDFNITDIASNVSIDSIGINTDEAMSNFNMSVDDIDIALEEAKENLTNDPILSNVNNFTRDSNSLLRNQSEDITNINIISHWIVAMENITFEYFSNESCASFLDCAQIAVSQLYDLFEEEENIPNRNESLDAISTLEDSFLGLLDNSSYTVVEVYSRTIEMQETIDKIIDYDVFCSEPPTMLSQIGNYNVTEGSTLQLFCNATGNPKPQIWWYRNDEHLPDQNDTVLIIYGVTKADESRYRCIAGNLIANLSSDYAEVYISGKSYKQQH